MRIICPECDDVIAITAEMVGSKVRCEHCGHSLRIHRKMRTLDVVEGSTASLPANRAQPLNESPTISSQATSGTAMVNRASANPVRNSATDNRPAHKSATMLNASQAHASDLIVKLRVRQRRRRMRSWAASAILAIVCAGAAIVGYYLTANRTNSTAEKKIASDDGQVNDLGISNVPIVDDVAGDSSTLPTVDSPRANPPIRLPIKPKDFGFFTPEEVQQAWQRIHPYVVSLIVESQQGRKEIGGVIINPQGWVATSLSALHGAKRVLVQQAPNDPLADASEEQILDEVRGVLGVFAEHDLAFLSVNRRLINSFVSMPMNARPLAARLFLLQVSPPGEDRWPWITETRLNESLLDRGISAERLSALRETGFRLDLHSMGHTTFGSTSPGGGLFDADGRLVALNSNVQCEGDLMVISAATIESVLPTLSGQVTDIRLLPGFVEDKHEVLAEETAMDSENDAMQAEQARQAKAIVDEMNQWGELLGSRGWRATTAEEYLQWRRLAASYQKLLPLANDVDRRPELRRTWIRQTDHWAARWRNELPSLTPQAIKDLNEWGVRSRETRMRDGDPQLPVVLVADVHLPIINSPQIGGTHTITLRISETDRFIIAERHPSDVVLLRDTQWLVFGQWIDRRPRSILDDRGETITVESFSILLLAAKIR